MPCFSVGDTDAGTKPCRRNMVNIKVCLCKKFLSLMAMCNYPDLDAKSDFTILSLIGFCDTLFILMLNWLIFFECKVNMLGLLIAWEKEISRFHQNNVVL